jgi:hypothetical protein
MAYLRMTNLLGNICGEVSDHKIRPLVEFQHISVLLKTVFPQPCYHG